MPANATVTFMSAASFLKSCGGIDSVQPIEEAESADFGKPTIEPPKNKAVRKLKTVKNPIENDATTKKPRKSKAEETEVADLGGEPKEKPARKPRVTKAKAVAVENSDETPARKPRAKKDNPKSQTTIPKARVTKATTVLKPKKAVTLKLSDVVCSDFDVVPENNTDPSQDPSDDSLHLTEAVRRRKDWTPPRATNPAPSIDKSSPGYDADSIIATNNLEEKIVDQNAFRNLVSGFSLDKGDSAPSTSTNNIASSSNGLKKRKLIEMVKSNVAIPSPPAASKAKAAKRKPRTITELATSAYIPRDDEGAKATPAPLLQYFSLDGAPSKPSPDSGFKVPTKPRSRSPTKRQTKKDQLMSNPTLLSPQSAMKRVDKQDFVFGTSSQLAREESPGLLRDLQAAMQASNEVDVDPFGYITAASRLSASSTQISAASEYTTKRSLWTAAARNSEGALMDVEVVDLSETPEVKKSKQTSASLPVPAADPSDRPNIADVTVESHDEWHQIDETDTPLARTKALTVPNKAVGPVEAAIRSELLSSPSSPKTHAPRAKPLVKRTGKAKKAPLEKPNFQAYTTAQLSKEVASYHFKPVKNRDQMITLLEKCWEGKQRIALGDLGANSVLQTSPNKSQKAAADSSVASPKRPRGRPRKDQVSSTLSKKAAEEVLSDSDTHLAISRTPTKTKVFTAEEIFDSDTPMTPSPPRRRAAKVGTPPQPLQLSISNDLAIASSQSLASEQAELHSFITRAVTTAPRSKDAQKPSWYEKILMYDPIVLEDLATWLNMSGLQRVGWDGEVYPAQVKNWCVEKSICCLWREKSRGGPRSRY